MSLVCTFTLALMAAALGGWTLSEAVLRYRLAGQVQQAVDISALLLTAADRLALERPATGGNLLAEAPADATALAAITARRRDFDRAIVQAEQRIAAMAPPGADRQLEALHRIRDRLAVLRREANTMLARPKSQRAPDSFARYVTAFSAIFETLDAVQDPRDSTGRGQEGRTMDLLDLARRIWSLRCLMRARTGVLMAAIDAASDRPGTPLSLDQLEAAGPG